VVTGIIKAKKSLIRIRKLIRNGTYRNELPGMEYWAGADLVVCEKVEETTDYAGDIVVASPHWREIIWVIEQLKHGCAPVLDYLNKFEFYPRLGLAANRYLESTREVNVDALLLSMVWEAECFLRDGGV
jgi:hypothetical protein